MVDQLTLEEEVNFADANEKHKKAKGKRGHMALRNNVQDLKLELWHELSPLEYYLVDIIIDKTIKWRTKEARIDPSEWLSRTRQKKQNVYAALKTLKEKKIITYRRDKYFSYYGLNEEYFGGLLIAKHEKAEQERRSKIKLAVDNSKSGHVKDDSQSSERLPSVIPQVTSSHIGDDRKQTQANETIDENGRLKTCIKDIYRNTCLKGGADPKTANTFISLLRNRKAKDWINEPTREDVEREKERQLKAAKAAGIL